MATRLPIELHSTRNRRIRKAAAVTETGAQSRRSSCTRHSGHPYPASTFNGPTRRPELTAMSAVCGHHLLVPTHCCPPGFSKAARRMGRPLSGSVSAKQPLVTTRTRPLPVIRPIRKSAHQRPVSKQSRHRSTATRTRPLSTVVARAFAALIAQLKALSRTVNAHVALRSTPLRRRLPVAQDLPVRRPHRRPIPSAAVSR